MQNESAGTSRYPDISPVGYLVHSVLLPKIAHQLELQCDKQPWYAHCASRGMAAQLTLPRITGATARRPIRTFRATPDFRLRRKVGTCCKVGAIAAFVISLPLALLVYSSYNNFAQLIDQQIAEGYLRSHAGLYAAPRVIEKGARISKDQLANSLLRAGYARERASNIWNGSFKVNEDAIMILPREGSEKYEWIKVNFDKQHTVSGLKANDGSDLPLYTLEPELLTEDASNKTGQQETLTYQDIPPVLVKAILAIEDRRFFEHSGVDAWGIGRAFLTWSTSGSMKFRQGGSTITQQLVKNTYLTPEKTITRKLNEALIAVALENRLSKQDIFALYCNEVYLGQRSGVGVRGVAQAARVFFGKPLKDISLEEAATLAGMIQSPARYAPDRNPDAARTRRDQVISAMARDGAIDSETERIARAQAVAVAPFEGSRNELAPYYIDSVNRAMADAEHGMEPETEQSLRVQTTIDPDLQTAAEVSLRHQLEVLGKTATAKGKTLQGAMVALDPHTGHVLAMVGGRSYEESQLNRVTDAKRQPGSVFKPFVYAAALESGVSPLAAFNDAPQTFHYGNATYQPANYGKAYAMRDVMMREGLVRSLNVVTVDLAMRTGLSRVSETAANFGLPRPAPYPAMALGTTEVTPLQIAAAYAAFANGGELIKPVLIARAFDSSTGEQLVNSSNAHSSVIKPTTAYMITDMLSDVIKRGTARSANGSLRNVAIAGKTGTSRDGWFVGYTPNLVCAVWIGFDDNQQLGLTGAEAAVPAWVDFMKEALAMRPSLGGKSFPKPAGIATVKIDPETGLLAGTHCRSALTVSVAALFAPSLECLQHRPEIELADEAYDLALETAAELPDSGGDLKAREAYRPDPAPYSSSVSLEHNQPSSPAEGATAKRVRPAAQTEVDREGRAVLVSEPAVSRVAPARVAPGRP